MRAAICLVILMALTLPAGALVPQLDTISPTAPTDPIGPLDIYELFTTPETPHADQSVVIHYRVRNNGPESFVGNFHETLRVMRGDSLVHEEERDVAADLSVDGLSDNLIGPLTVSNAGEYKVVVEIVYGIDSKQFKDKAIVTVDVSSKELTNSQDDKSNQPLQRLMIMAVVIFIIIMMIGAIFIYVLTHRKRKAIAGMLPVGPTPDAELEELYKKKAEIESMIKLAKIKYYKRKMDEESYKEIMKKNEERLIEIEAKINEMANRVKVLEETKK